MRMMMREEVKKMKAELSKLQVTMIDNLVPANRTIALSDLPVTAPALDLGISQGRISGIL